MAEQDLKHCSSRDQPGIPRVGLQAPRARRSPARARIQALPLRRRAIRRSHPQETQAPAQGSNGAYRAKLPQRSGAHFGRPPSCALSRGRVVLAPPHKGGPHSPAPSTSGPASGRPQVSSKDADRSRGLALHLAALLVAVGVGLWLVGRAGSVPFLILAAFFVFFFRDPDRTIRPRPEPRRVASRRARDDRRACAGPGAPAGSGSRSASSCRRWTCTSIGAGRRARSRAWSIIPGSSCPPTRRRPGSSTSGPRSGSITPGRPVVVPPDRRHPRAPHRVPADVGQHGAPRRALRGDEVRLAHRSVPAAVGAIVVKVGDRSWAARRSSRR